MIRINSKNDTKRPGKRPGLPLAAMLALLLSGCAGASDFLSKDAEWFSRPSRMFNQASLAIETPPLSAARAITQDDLISAEGYCSGMTPPSEANAMSDAALPSTGSASGTGVALGQSECDVARYAGAPDNVNISNGERGDRLAVLTYVRGPRPGIYRFSAGRLASIERGPEPVAPARPARAAKKKKTA